MNRFAQNCVGAGKRARPWVRPLSVTIGLLALLGSCPRPAFAVDRHWTGATTADWNTSGNWDTAIPSAGDNAVFDGTFTNQPTLNNNKSAGGLWMTGSVGQNVTISDSGALILSLSGGTINGTAGLGILIDNANASTLTITAPVKIGGAQIWRNNSGNLFTVGVGGININNNAFTIDGTGNTAVTGVMSGAGAFTKDGTGTLTLSGTNTYTGTTTVTAGILNIQNAAALGGTGSGTTVSSGAALQIQGSIAVGAEALTLNGTGISSTGALRNISGTNSWSGAVTLGSASEITSDAGTLTLSGAFANGGFLATFGGAGNSTVSGVLSGTGGLTKTGAGTLTLSGTSSNTFTGTLTVNDGTVLFNKTANLNSLAGALVIGDGVGLDTVRTLTANQLNGAAVTINSSGLLDLNGTSHDITTLTMTGGSVTTGAGTLLLAGTVTGNANATAATISGNLALGANRIFNIADGAAALDMDISAVVSGAFTVTKNGTGTMVFSGANTYSGATTVSAGVLNIQNATALGTTAAGTTVSTGAALQIQGNIAVGAEALTLGGNGISNDGALRNISGSNSWSGNLTLGSASTIASDAGTLTLSGTLTNAGFGLTVGGAGNVIENGIVSGTGALTKNGTGTLTLFGANTFTGGATINSGTVQIDSASSLGLTSVAAVINSGTLQVTQTFSTSRNFTLGASDSAIAVDASKTWTATGILSGSGGLTKNGAGTLTLAAVNTYSGGSTINDGTVVVNSSASLGAIGGGLTINAGTLEVSTGFSTTRTITLGNAASTFQVDPSQTYTVTTAIGGTGSLNKTGTGTMALGASNTFTGNTTVSAGTLAANADGALGSTAKVTINTGGTVLLGTTAGNNRISNTAEVALAGGTLNTGGFSETVGKMTLSGNSTLDLGAGASLLTFDGVSTLGSSTLSVLNWTGTQGSGGGTDQLLFSNSSFTAGSSTFQIQFNVGGTFYAAQFVNAGANTLEAIAGITPVPEPGTIFGAGALLLAIAWRERKRLARPFRKA